MTLSNVQEAARGWEAARHAEREARNGLSDAIRDARATGVPLSVLAGLLGVSRERVRQLSQVTR